MSDTPWPPPLAWPDEPLTDGVVLLSRLTFADVERVVLGCTDSDTQRWLPLPAPYGEAEARSFIGSRDHAAECGNELTFGVRDAADGLLAGAIGLSQRGYRHEADIGSWTAPDRRGRGWTARGVRLLARYALTTMPLRRIEILAAVENQHSRGVAAAAGALFEGIRRNGLPLPDEGNAAVYSLIRSDVAGDPPDDPAYIEGSLTSVTLGDEGGAFLVEEPGDTGNKASVTLRSTSVVLEEVGDRYESTTPSRLQQGQTVAVWAAGPVRESFPVQISAGTVVIRGH